MGRLGHGGGADPATRGRPDIGPSRPGQDTHSLTSGEASRPGGWGSDRAPLLRAVLQAVQDGQIGGMNKLRRGNPTGIVENIPRPSPRTVGQHWRRSTCFSRRGGSTLVGRKEAQPYPRTMGTIRHTSTCFSRRGRPADLQLVEGRTAAGQRRGRIYFLCKKSRAKLALSPPGPFFIAPARRPDLPPPEKPSPRAPVISYVSTCHGPLCHIRGWKWSEVSRGGGGCHFRPLSDCGTPL